MAPIYQFEKNHIKILNRDVNIELLVDNITSRHYDNDFGDKFLWEIRVRFYIQDNLKWILPLDKEYETLLRCKYGTIWNGFDVVGIMMKFCRMYEEYLIASNAENLTIQSLEQKLKEWDGSFEVENKEIE